MYNAFAQNQKLDTIMHIPEIVIVGHNKEVVEIGSKVEQIDTLSKTLYNQQMLADVLTAQSSVFIKNYTIGGLASPSFRGFNMSQTALLWNGFSISSPLYGGYDLSLLPNSMVDQIALQSGGATSLWGSGAIGGTIHLSNQLLFEQGIRLNASIQSGSFQNNSQGLGLLMSGKKIVSDTRFFNRYNKNNFTFYNTARKGFPLDTMEHAAVHNIAGMQQLAVKITPNQVVSACVWIQNNNREIPASLTSKTSVATQNDRIQRYTLSWNYEKNNRALTVRTAYFNEKLMYHDPAININDTSQASTYISQGEYLQTINNYLKLFIGMNYTFQKGKSDNFTFSPTQHQTVVFYTLKFKNKKSTIISALSVRQAWVSTQQKPFTASYGLEIWPLHTFRIRGNISKNYRLPTFNDLYWSQGGNENLKPESGHSEEIALGYYKYGNKLSIQTEIIALTNQVRDWIMWIPNANNVWQPMNAQYVWSRGFEFDFKSLWVHNQWKFSLGFHAQKIQTTIEKVNATDLSSLHKQMIYTPMYKLYTSIGSL
jgi:iron complex outermembrane receptor protein